MKIHDIINEAVSRAEAEKLWSTEIVKPRSERVLPVDSDNKSTARVYIKPKAHKHTEKTIDPHKKILKLIKKIDKHSKETFPNLKDRVKQIAKRDDRNIDSELLRDINHDDYYFPRTLEGELPKIIPMDQRLQNLIDEYEKRENKLKDWIKYPAKY